MMRVVGGDTGSGDAGRSTVQMLPSALYYAKHGWAVFPLLERGKEPLTKGGLKDATSDVRTVEGWWKRWPGANIGIACGAPSGLDVLDIDGPDGERVLADLVEEHGPIPRTFESRTAGGRHLFFWSNARVQSTANILGDRLLTLSKDSWVVVPPSIHPNGQRYDWYVDPKQLEAPAAWPAWMVDLLFERTRRKRPSIVPPAPRRDEEETQFVTELIKLEVAQFLASEPGTLIDALARAGSSLGEFVGAGTMTEHEVRGALISACARTKLLDNNDPATIDHLIHTAIDRGRALFKAPRTGAQYLLDDTSIIAPHPLDDDVDAPAAGGGGGDDGEGGDDGGDGGDGDGGGGPHWTSQLALTQKGQTQKSLGNLIIILENQGQWVDILGYDERNAEPVWLSTPPFDPDELEGPYPRPLRDGDEPRIVRWLEDVWGLEWPVTKVHQALGSVASRRRFDRVVEYLEGLSWDGKERLDGWLVDFMGAKATPLTQAISARWMISAVARALDPGCQVDHVLVLEGKQGAGKSSALRALCRDKGWFTDQLGDVRSKEASETLQGPWLVEIAELDALSRAEAHTVKAFLTRVEDRYRPSYGRHVQRRPRRCVFAATTNEQAYLKDATGGRRFWPVDVQGPIRVKAIAAQRDQLWAEAVWRYRQGEAWYLDDDALNIAAQAAQEERFTADEWENVLETWLHEQETKYRLMGTRARITVGDALQQVGLKDSRDWERRHQMRVADILARMGWYRKRRRDGDGGRNRWAYEPPEKMEPPPPDPLAEGDFESD
ncbi:MAG TPA: VapE domain-containing protein [Myxococcota bacterium]